MSYYYYILDKHVPIIEPDFIKWAEWMSKRNRKLVKRTKFKGKLISTVFLGIDHNFLEEGSPILFETMVFNNNSWDDIEMKRYHSWDEAVKGHNEIVKKYKSKKN